MIRIEKNTDFLYEVWYEVALFGGECVCLVFARTSTLLPFVRVAVQVGGGSLLPLARHS
jgi:hypothetical protein